MNRAKEMYQFCLDNGHGKCMFDIQGINHFKVIENHLKDSETVKMAFIGLKNIVSSKKHENNYAFAITDKRIIFAQKKFRGSNIDSIPIKKIKDMYVDIDSDFGKGKKTYGLSVITFETSNEIFNVALATSFVLNTYAAIDDVFKRFGNNI